jgi:hypothetical protein
MKSFTEDWNYVKDLDLRFKRTNSALNRVGPTTVPTILTISSVLEFNIPAGV